MFSNSLIFHIRDEKGKYACPKTADEWNAEIAERFLESLYEIYRLKSKK